MYLGSVARGGVIVVAVEKSTCEEENPITALDLTGLEPRTGIVAQLLRAHYLILAPWVVFSAIPDTTFLGFRIPVTLGVITVGLIGSWQKRRRLVVTASVALLALLVMGKVATDLLQLGSPDTGILLLQFILILFLMEMSLVVVQYDQDLDLIGRSDDPLSETTRTHLARWLGSELRIMSRLGVGSFVFSLGLLVVGGLASFQIDHIAVLAALVLATLLALLFLLTYRREPETKKTL